MNIVDLSSIEIQTYLMVLARIGGMFGVAPVFGSNNIPRQAKAAMSLVLALVIFPGISKPPSGYPNDLISYAVFIGKEIGVGLIIGFIASLITSSVQIAGQLIDMQIGFGMVNIVDPVSGMQVTVIGQFQYIIAILLFLGTNSHHILLKAIGESYRLVPISGLSLNKACQIGVVGLFKEMFSLAFRIAAPITCALLLTDVVMAVLARAVPQMNVFIVGFPLKIASGLLILAITIPVFASLLKGSFHKLESGIAFILRGAY